MRPSTDTAMRAVCRLERNSETSLIAVTSWRPPRPLTASMRSGVSMTWRAFLIRAGNPEARYWFSKKPTVPRFMPKIGVLRRMLRWSACSISPSPPSATTTSACAGVTAP